jgi:hypothetical protein
MRGRKQLDSSALDRRWQKEDVWVEVLMSASYETKEGCPVVFRESAVNWNKLTLIS